MKNDSDKASPNQPGQTFSSSTFAPWPYFDQVDIDATVAVLKSGRVNWWTGDEGRTFEREFADFVGVDYAIALANGTVALELALYALGIGPGDEVITSSRTFIASASAVVMRGAKPVIADVDPVSQNISLDTIREVFTPATKAIIAVHLAGWPCDMDPIMEFARQNNLKVIEDCAQAHGAVYNGRMVGSIGDAGAFSFCQDKIMTSGGEGGMLTTNDPDLWRRAWAFKDHGKSFDAVYNRQHPPGFRWLHESFGTNWRLSEIQSALGRTALKKLPQWLELRRKYAGVLSREFKKIRALEVAEPPSNIKPAFYKYYTFIRDGGLPDAWGRDRIIAEINAEGVPCFSGSCSEIYLEKAFSASGFGPSKRLPVAKSLGERSLMFLVHPTLTELEIIKTTEVVKEIFKRAELV